MKTLLVGGSLKQRCEYANTFAKLCASPRIYRADSVSRALACLRTHPDISLVLISNESGDEFCWHVLSTLSDSFNDVLFAVVSWRGDYRTVREAVNRGAQGFLCLPIDTIGNIMGLKRLLRGKPYLPPPAAVANGSAVAEPAAASALSAPTATELPARKLTPRQIDVLELIRLGKSNKEIARILDVSEGTVKIHCVAIYRELEVTSRTQAALIAEQMRLL